jgi:hypothetical protein
MKIYGDRASAGIPAEKNEKPAKLPQPSKSGSSTAFIDTKDDLELTGKKVAVSDPVRETELANTDALEFDAGEVPVMKQKLQALSSYILSNPAEALSAQANLNPDMVAGLII